MANPIEYIKDSGSRLKKHNSSDFQLKNDTVMYVQQGRN